MEKRVALTFSLLLAGGVILINDQNTYRRDFMNIGQSGVSRLDDEKIERALASTIGFTEKKAYLTEESIAEIVKPTLPVVNLDINKKALNQESTDEEALRPSDLAPRIFYLFEAYIPEKRKVSGKEQEIVSYLNSDPQFSQNEQTIQGTLEYQYDYFDEFGVSRTVMNLEINRGSNSISLWPIFIKDRANVYYVDSEGNRIHGKISENNSKGQHVLEFDTGDYKQQRFVFCRDLMSCAEQRMKEIEKKKSEEFDRFDSQEPIGFNQQETETQSVEASVTENPEVESFDGNLIEENLSEEYFEEVDNRDILESRDQNSTPTEGNFEGLIQEKIENKEELIKDEFENKGSIDYKKQDPEDIVEFSEAQVESDNVYRFRF